MPSVVSSLKSCLAGLLVLCGGQVASAQAVEQLPNIDLSQFKLVWSDEFDGNSLDTTKWQAPTQTRQGSSRWRPELVSVKDGVLRMGIVLTADPTLRYDCGAVRSTNGYEKKDRLFEQRYGYFEARCKMPKNIDADYWAAFWMMCGAVSDKSDTQNGTEIDIMESFTFCKTGEHALTMHWGGYGKNHNAYGIKCGLSPQVRDGEFHTFGLYWDENWYVSFLDGVEVGRTNMVGFGKEEAGKTKSVGTCRQPGYLKLSVEAAPWSGKSHLWEKEMPAADEFLVDYVRVYQGTLPPPAAAKEAAAGPVIPPEAK